MSHRSKVSASACSMIERLENRCLMASTPAPITAAASASVGLPTRVVENLGRGVTVVRASSTQALVSWRLLALDSANISFNVYRATSTGAAVKLNSSPITASTNFADTTANFAVDNRYYVKPILNGVEQPASGSFTLTANHAVEPIVRVPLRDPGEGYVTKYVWVGDFDGDGEYDFLIDRQSNNGGQQRIEAYKRDGTFLWDVDLGPSSTNTYNIEPGAATIDVGNWDGVTVFDMDSDGKAEVLLKTASGVRFGDGTTLTNTNPNIQYLSVLNGMTGAERARTQFNNPYLADGPMAMMMTVGYPDGVHPSLIVKAKNRVGNGGFNMTVGAYGFDGSKLTQQWQWVRTSGTQAPDGHNIRMADVDGDGRDEFLDIGFALNSDGTFRYSLNTTGGVIHGDRFYVGDYDPARPGLEGFGVQQDNPSLLEDYYYDAATGEMIWQHFGQNVVDVGRGLIADIDPTKAGAETWQFRGLYNAQANTQISTTSPWPAFSLHWDGDLTAELYNDGKLEQWNPTTKAVERVLTPWQFGGLGYAQNPLMIGDLFGDWREELVMQNSAGNELMIFTTNQATSTRIYTLAQNPLYRNGMTAKGYMQSHGLDYFLGAGMTTPPTPNVIYAGTTPAITNAYQAEVAVRLNTPVESNYGGYNGTGFANLPTSGGSVTWNNVDAGLGGTTTIGFRYALGAAASRVGRLTVNGVSQNITFDTTGGWGRWATLTVAVPLTAGRANTIRLDSTGNDLANIDELQVTAFAPPAAVLSGITINDGSAQRSMVKSVSLTFDRPVNLIAEALSLRTGTTDVPFTLSNPAGDGRQFVLTFSGAQSAAGSLLDGLYVLTVNADTTLDNFGQHFVGGDRSFTFARLFGDTDGDRDVDGADSRAFRVALNSTATSASYRWFFDFDQDGDIDGADSRMFRSRLDTTL